MNPALAMVLLYLTTASAEGWDRCRCMKYPSTGTPNDCATIKACGSGKYRAISIYKNGDIWCEKTDVAIQGPEFHRTCYDLLQDPKRNPEADSCCIKGNRASDGCFK